MAPPTTASCRRAWQAVSTEDVTAPGARAEYARRLRRVLAHIDEQLAEPLELKDLASVAHFSPYHFHRIFAAWMGETLGDYLRRRRLERAALMLRSDPALPVLNAALEVGFGSGEAFSRAFKTRFGYAPSAWRRLRKTDQACSNLDQASGSVGFDDEGVFSTFSQEPTMNVEVKELPAARIATLRYTGPYGAPIGEFWAQRAVPWARSLGLGPGTRYGISYDDPSNTPPSECRYDAGFEVPPDFVASSDAQIQQLPGGLYAVARFHGSAIEIERAWPWMLREWLPDSGYQMDDRPCFERQGPNDSGGGPGLPFDCDICIPVKPL
jgi:AraC family transcriptional regulator